MAVEKIKEVEDKIDETNDRSDLQLAVDVLTVKREPYTELFDYYDGEHPFIYFDKNIRLVEDESKKALTPENWCKVVIDTTYDRVRLLGFMVEDKRIQTQVDGLVRANELLLESEAVHEAAGIVGESFMIVWPSEEEDTIPEAYYNDPRLVEIFYDPDNPRRKKFAAKWWESDNGKWRLNLYYPDEIYYYETLKSYAGTSDIPVAKDFVEMSEEPFISPSVNKYGIVPVFHFMTNRRRITSDLEDAINNQRRINKLIDDMMVSSEFGASPFRYTISSSSERTIQVSPRMLVNIPAQEQEGVQPTAVGQLDAVSPDVYIKNIEASVISLGIITKTPQHYLLGGAGANLSGEALIALEAPLVKKCQTRIDHFAPVWREVVNFMLVIAGTDKGIIERLVRRFKAMMKIETTNADEKPVEITPIFAKPETVQPRTEAEIRQINDSAGIPVIWSLRQEGKTKAEIDQFEKDRKAEDARSQKNRLNFFRDATDTEDDETQNAMNDDEE